MAVSSTGKDAADGRLDLKDAVSFTPLGPGGEPVPSIAIRNEDVRISVESWRPSD
jgi:hypothetical protein